MAKPVVVTANKVVRRKKEFKTTKIVLLIALLLVVIIFTILALIYNGGKFVISLDPNFSLESGIVLFENLEDKDTKRKLYAEEINFMDNISINWLPSDIDGDYEGSHNGDNYIAYTFYIENQGSEVLNYWYQVYIDDVIKNVDEAVRIMIFRNGQKTVYAKINEDTKKPEKDTEPFYSKDIAVLESRSNFEPGNIDKFTIVVWLEGDDPDCVNAIIGGEIKMHMDISEEHIDQNDYNNDDNKINKDENKEDNKEEKKEDEENGKEKQEK